jgi:hypothetical protein
MSFKHLSSLSVSALRKIRKLILERKAILGRAGRLQKRIRKMEKAAYASLKKRKYQRRIKIASKKVNSINGRFDVKFENPVITKLTGMCFQVLRFVPKGLKLRLQKEGQWDDVAQTLYATVIEFFRSKNGNVTENLSKSDYKELVNLANKNVRRTLCDLVAGFGHKMTEKSVHPKRLDSIPVSVDGGSPGYVHEKTLYSFGNNKSDEKI